MFQGRITVQPGAQQTDARMMARALLLSDEAVAIASPSWRSSQTTCSAATAPRPAHWTTS